MRELRIARGGSLALRIATCGRARRVRRPAARGAAPFDVPLGIERVQVRAHPLRARTRRAGAVVERSIVDAP